MLRLALSAPLLLLMMTSCDTGGGTSHLGDTTTTADTSEADTATTQADTTTAPVDAAIPDEPRDFVNGAVGRVLHVVDGDTVIVNVGQVAPLRYKVRLQGINAPECLKKDIRTREGDWLKGCSQDEEYYGLASYEGMVALAEGKQVVISCDNPQPGGWCPQDDYGRYLAYLEVNGQDLSTQMAWKGNALSYTIFYSSKRAAICAAEYDARDKDRGMWAAGTVSEVIARMSDHTQSWYQTHDTRCDQAID